MIELTDVTAHYGTQRTPVLNGVSLVVQPNETMVLLGGSGAGKSTILRAIMRLMTIDAGTITLDGTDITTMDTLALRRQIGMVFQGIALFPHLSVGENIALPLRLAHADGKTVQHRVNEVLQLVGLDPTEFGPRYPHMLSGGQQQRVGVARALAPRPNYLLMDEPFGALDAITRRNLQHELKQLRSKLGITIVFVTHDVMEAASLGDRVAVMDEGRIVQASTVRELLEDPQHETVRQLVSVPLGELKSFVKDSVQ